MNIHYVPSRLLMMRIGNISNTRRDNVGLCVADKITTLYLGGARQL